MPSPKKDRLPLRYYDANMRLHIAIGTTTKKPAPKKPAPKKGAKKADSPAPAPAGRGKKRKADDDEADEEEASAKPAKKAKAPKAAPKVKARTIINTAPMERLHVFVFGEGTAGELGLGTEKNCIDVKRPRLNAKLDAQTVGVVQIVAGGMHNVALTHENRILSWGVNDQGALGRDTTWNGGVKDIDAEDSDSDDDDTGLNPIETAPTEVDFSKTEDLDNDVVWVEVAAGDSCSFALTNDGKVYGWGTFRGNEGIFGFAKDVYIATRPMLIAGLKNITSIKAGANHALALDNKGHVFAWGSGQQNQLGRKVVERTKVEGLTPREFGLPKGAKSIASIETGGYHSFAISKNGDVWSWGLNNFGETGIPHNAGQDDAVILKPEIVQGLQGKNVVSIKGGGHHSVCALDNGDCLVWGRLDGNQCGLSKDEIAEHMENTITDERGEPRILTVPTKVDSIKGNVVKVTACSDHNIVITEDGRAYSWGFSANYQTGQGTIDDVVVATLIDNTALRAAKLNGCTSGGQFSVVTGTLTDNPDVGKK
jgi:regulator of chromosome condensation